MKRASAASASLSPVPRDLGKVAIYLGCFLGLTLFFLLGQTRATAVYDEGLALTAAMRVMAGQVVHRDFYYNYGPGSIYILAALFRLFGPSVLVARLFGIAGSAVLVTSTYWMVRQACSRWMALLAALLCALWIVGEAGGAIGFLPVFILWPTWLISSALERTISARKAFAAGLLVGIAALFRYDMGSGLVACHFLVVAIGEGLRTTGLLQWLKAMVRNLWAYALGVALILVPLLLAYVRAGSFHDMLFDIVLYTAKYYRVGRGMPFPRPNSLAQSQELVIYVLLVLILISFVVALRRVMEQRRKLDNDRSLPQWVGVLVAFGLVALMLFAKASVRIGAGGALPSLLCCIILAAVLIAQRLHQGLLLQGTVALSTLALLMAGALACLHQVSAQRKSGGSTLLWILHPAKMPPLPPDQNWCTVPSALTRGLCFLMDKDHMHTVEFLLAHTTPKDTLYVGIPKHDRIILNDNLTYFATQRLPATKWSHFDPFLQNSEATQREMVADLERNKPPYVAIDREFDTLIEPNGSSIHTGVHLLDDYISANYHWVKTFGEMTILQRTGSDSTR